jgi:transmembrane sensor
MNAGIPPIPPELRGESDPSELERIWAELEAVRPAPVPVEATDQDWAELRARMGTSALARELEVRSRPHPGPTGAPSPGLPRGVPEGRVLSFRRGLAAAAVLLLLATGSLALVGLPGRAVALPGESVAVTLPDGSRAELNSGSSIRWRRSVLPGASPPRSYRLSGEAFLSVVAGARPFVVETFNAEVTVLGTRFNVRAREGGTEVVLEEGRVRLAHGETGVAVELSPGEGARVPVGAQAPEAPEPVEVDRVLVWRERGFSAVQVPLSGILAELSLRYAVEIGLAGEVDGSQRLTVHYARLGDLREVLSDLATARGLRFRETNGGFEVY